MAQQDVIVPVVRDDGSGSVFAGSRDSHQPELVTPFHRCAKPDGNPGLPYHGASEEDAEAAIQVAQALNGVAEVRYVSREEAFRELQEMFQEKATVLEGIENPLPASIRLTTFRPEDVPDVVARLREIPCVDDVIYQEEASRNLAVLGRVSQVLSLGGTVIVGLVAITVIGNSTRMTIEARRHEIGIMKLVGATDGFVVGPFVLTGIVLGMFGGLLEPGSPSACTTTLRAAWKACCRSSPY
jgi:cell division protein FtsX